MSGALNAEIPPPIRTGTSRAGSWLGADLDSKKRWTICWLLFLVTAINYLDRQVFSILIPDLQQRMRISELAYGRLVIAFQLSYALTMVAAGRFLDRVGARLGLALGVLVWSAAEAGHAIVRSALGFGFARFLLGFGEATNFPACMKVVADLFPAGERAIATGIVNSATAVGAIAAPILVPLLAEHYGWQAAFIVTSLAGILWLAVWIAIHRRADLKRQEMPVPRVFDRPTVAEGVKWGVLFRYRQLWAIVLARIIVDPIWYFYLFWLPKFLAQGHGIRGTAATPYLSGIFVCSGIGCIASGYFSSMLIRLGWSVNRARKTVMWTLVAVMSPALLVADRFGGLGITMAIIGLAVGAHQAFSTHLYTLASDLFPSRVTGVVVGLGSCLSGLCSVVTAELTGRVLQRDPTAYVVLFATAACLYPCAMLVIQMLAPKLQPATLDSTPPLSQTVS